MRAKITSPGNYADGTPRFEIGIYNSESDHLPNTYHQRITYHLNIGAKLFICGLNSTETAGCWIAPDIYDFHNPIKRLRLSEVLLNEGFSKNEEVQIEYTPEKKELLLSKVTT